ncbi:hypothetical protein GB937_010863, partial [Aspergillus fischeri]
RPTSKAGLVIPPELDKKIGVLVGHNFSDRYVIWEALTHPSWRRDTSTGSYQRLEFLGDAILDMIIARRLYQNKPQLTESQMTQIKAAMVNGNFLAFLCRNLGLEEEIVQIYEPRTGVFDRVLQKDRLELWRFMRHDSPDVPAAQQSCVRRAGEGTLWKAATYMKPRETWGCVSALHVGSNELVENEDKAQAFLDTFFPKMDQPLEDPPIQAPLELPWPPITELEVQRSLKAAKSSTAPGEDGLPTLVWKCLWKAPPETMAESKDRGVAETWEAGLLDPWGLSPDLTPQHTRTTEQALLVLSNAIDQAWYKHAVMTLVAFDLKGAFNDVNKISLDARLRAKGIPAIARKWIASFMSDRFANIGFDDFRTEVAPLVNAGLAQGLPLSPILFTFFNSDLVDQPVTFHGGASAFIDDYFRWRSEDIPRIEAWAQQIGSCFAAEKTELIHITRKRSEQLQGQIVINGKTIEPSPTAKLLGVIFDHEPRWKEHVQQAIKRATKVTIALAGLRHLRLEQMRQIYQALDELETIDPSPLPPWRVEPFAEIEVGSDRETAVERAETTRFTSDIVVYSDVSGREGHLGAAVVALNSNLETVESQQIQVGPMDRWSVHVAELIGIFYAISMVFKVAHQLSRGLERGRKTATILCDSRSALQATQNPRNKSGQQIIHAILQAATEVQTEGISLHLQWVPGHCDNPGNDAADRLAKDAARPGKTQPFCPLPSMESARLRGNILNQWEQEWRSSNKGGHL